MDSAKHITCDERRRQSELVEEALSIANVKKVTVFQIECCWHIELFFPRLMSYSTLMSYSDAFLSCCDALKKIEITPYYDLSNDLDEPFSKDALRLLKENLYWLHPEIRLWLMNATFELTKMELTIILPSKMGLEQLSKENYANKIQSTIREHFSLPQKVNLIYEKEQHQTNRDSILLKAIAERTMVSTQPALGAAISSPKKGTPNEKSLLYGKKQKNAALITLSTLQEHKENRVAVEGEIFHYKTVPIKNGSLMHIFYVTDKTDSVTVKLIEKESARLLAPLQMGMSVRVVGDIQFDRYSGELVLLARSIEEFTKTLQTDTAPHKRVELHLHTKFSSMDALVDIESCIATAARWGHPAVAVTDHGVVQAFPNAYHAGKKYGIKVLYGLEGYLIQDEKKIKTSNRYHVVILAQNQVGLRNLYNIVSKSHLEYFYRRPLIPRELLSSHREGLLIGSACESGELYQAFLAKENTTVIEEISKFYDYFEIQPIENNRFLLGQKKIASIENLIEINKEIVDLGKRMNKPVVATGDVHFLRKEDSLFRKILFVGQGYEDDEQAPLYLRTTQEMLEEFSYLNEADRQAVVIDYPQRIADMIDELIPVPSGFFPPKIDGAEDEIKEMTWSMAERLYGKNLPPEVRNRIEKELSAIIGNGFAVLYLIAHKLVKKSNDDGYLVGSRGSVGSSLVATLTGITEVNPLPPHYLCRDCNYAEFTNEDRYGCGADLPTKSCPHCNAILNTDGHNIPFEVFMGFKGDKIPDIDLNFSGEYQSRAHKYTEELFGADRVYRAGTIATIADKTAYGFVKNYLEDSGILCREAEKERLVKNCTGVKRTTGQHPGGLMIVPSDIDIHHFTPIQRPADDVQSGIITTHFDYHSIHDCLVKLDILGHDDPTMIKMLEDFTGISAKDILLNDAQTLALFSSQKPLHLKDPKLMDSTVGTVGIPEFGTRFVRGMLEETRPETFSDLVKISGLSHGTDVWLNNAQKLIQSGTATLKEAITCRDDIMVYLLEKELPPIDAFKIMEDVRKGKGVKEEYKKMMQEHHVPDWYIDSCEKIKYMFPKAHAVAYVTMAFRIAYFKVYYPESFYAAYFSVRGDDFDAQLICQGLDDILNRMKQLEEAGNAATVKEKSLYSILEVAVEMYLRGIKLDMVDLKLSDPFHFKIRNSHLLCPFITLKGLGDRAAKNIAHARDHHEIRSIEDLQSKAKLTKTVVQVLIDNHVLEELPEKNQLTMF